MSITEQAITATSKTLVRGEKDGNRPSAVAMIGALRPVMYWITISSFVTPCLSILDSWVASFLGVLVVLLLLPVPTKHDRRLRIGGEWFWRI